jgi:diaminohydroxyphosphoribosylaminopyrimidine deaminase/5-amino-6-(5-phosphoribosylamino)uracil reductase
VLELGRREMNELHIEAGAKLNSALFQANCINELLLYVAPSLLGDAVSMFNLPVLHDLTQRHQLRFHHVQQVGDDLRLLVRF